MKYTAINIGPILSTLQMAKRPRELWSASYLFSHLMRCIIEKLPKDKIISPAIDIDLNAGVGLFPDRVFIEGEINIKNITKEALKQLKEETKLPEEVKSSYFNIMGITLDIEEKNAIKELNTYLNFLELSSRGIDDAPWKQVFSLVKNQYTSPLFKIAFPNEGNSSKLEINTLGEIATYALSQKDNKKWIDACTLAKIDDYINESNYKIIEEDTFYKELKEEFKKDFKSHYKYICVVQADGDNMGTIVSNIPVSEVKCLSSKLLEFGSAATKIIKEFGGFPIYAGGDDLLFIAPVTSITKDNTGNEKTQTILDLLSLIDKKYKEVEDFAKEKIDKIGLKDKKGKTIYTSMSYGLSINYYKHPLYEALESARNLLFNKAKNINEKNAISWCLQKHSGSSFSGTISKSNEILYQAFQNIITTTSNEDIVTSIAHKIRENHTLMSLFIEKGKKSSSDYEDYIKLRLDAFFENIIKNEEKNANKEYLDVTKKLLSTLYLQFNNAQRENGIKDRDIEKESQELTQFAYTILRTAKFINGEEDIQ